MSAEEVKRRVEEREAVAWTKPRMATFDLFIPFKSPR